MVAHRQDTKITPMSESLPPSETPHFHDHAASHVQRGPLFVVVVVSVVIHLIIGIICGIVIVVGKFVEPPKVEFEEPPTVVEQPQEIKQEVKKRTRAAARVAPKRLITSKAPSTLVIPMPEIRTNVQGKIGGTGTSAIGTLDGEIGGEGLGSFFGNTSGLASDLVGVFYDLKQFKDGKQNRNMDAEAYKPVVAQFCRSWNTNLLEKYFKADRPLYLTHLWIPSSGANSAAEAPKAFGVQDKCKPSQWIAHYKGRITAPESGKYRFWGCGDDILVVRVDNRTILDGSHQAWSPTGDNDRYEDTKGLNIGGTNVAAGRWINLAKGHARPIRAEHLKLPADVQAKLLPNEQYGAAQPIKNAEAWEATSKKLPQMWQEQVIIEME